MFSIACMAQASLIVPIPKSPDWRMLLKQLMKGIQEIEPMESLIFFHLYLKTIVVDQM